MTNVLADWDPRKEPDKLEALAAVATALHDGRHAFEERLNELGGGYPGGGSRGGDESPADDHEPVAAPSGLMRCKVDREEWPCTAARLSKMAEARRQQEDVAARERREFERELEASLGAAARAWARYKRVVEPRAGVVKLTDPGCDLCTKVPGHWCPVYGVRVILTEPKSRGAKAKTEAVRLCDWCFRCTWESRMGRLPTTDEVVAHSEGRRVNWRGGVEPRLVEVPCPECKDESRAARRACTTCGHTGKVLKAESK